MTKLLPFAFPILPGKTEQLNQYNEQIAGPRSQEYQDVLKKINVERERDYLQKTPNGDFFIGTWEGENPEASLNAFNQINDEFNQWNKQQIKEMSGVDTSDITPETLPELLIDTENQVTGNTKLIAFVSPILPGKMEEWKKLNDELTINRRNEFIELHKSNNVRERTFLQKTPDGGGVIIVTLEGENPENYLKQLAEGTGELNKFFQQGLKEVHGFDLADLAKQPLPEQVYDSKQPVKEGVLVG
jgi:hypothetical protein